MSDPLSILELVKNFSKEISKFAKAGAPTVTEDEYKDRLQTCATCEHFLRERRCGLCGCVVAMKAQMKTADCPDNRWTKDL